MKKCLILIGCFVCWAMNPELKAQVLEKGNFLIDSYYGFPNQPFFVNSTKNNDNFLFKESSGNSDKAETIRRSGFGPLGLRAEYLIAKNFGIGLDICYSNKFCTNRITEYDASIFSNVTSVYKASYASIKIGMIPTFNVHFIHQEDMDLYFNLGAGPCYRIYRVNYEDPGNKEDEESSRIIVGYRISFGLRHFFTKSICLNTAFGFGQGSFINAGLSFRL